MVWKNFQSFKKSNNSNNEKFLSLNSDIEKNEKENYHDALNYAFKNKNIKNIAITGIYGSGKSTVWKTWIHSITDKKSKLKIDENNVIHISLNEFNKKKFSKNRIEEQIINQILLYANRNVIPLSHYKIKSSKLWRLKSFFKSIMLICFLASLTCFLIFVTNKDFLPSVYCLLFNSSLTIIPAILFAYHLFKNDNFKKLKFKFKNIETNVDLKQKKSIFDKEINEIVYVLKASKIKVVVFEDLDRFDDIQLLTKLRELNFLVNIKNDKTIRFVYIIRDDLFKNEEERTKFFDFIIPIIPVLNSQNSKEKLKIFIEDIIVEENNIPDNKFLSNISLYISDMRLLKNIVNEYKVYSNLINTNRDLSKNNLFAIVVLKNINPYEYDLLLKDEGFIHQIFSKIKDYKNDLVKQCKQNIDKILTKINFLSTNKSDYFDYLASLVPVNWYLETTITTTMNTMNWKKLIEWLYSNPENKITIRTNNYSGNFNYEGIVSKIKELQSYDDGRFSLIESDREIKISEFKNEIKQNEDKINNIYQMSLSKILDMLDNEKVESIFKYDDSHVKYSKKQIDLIRYLIINGFINEMYWYYIGYMYEKSLTRKDQLFLMKLKEGKVQNIFHEINNPPNVYNELNNEDFKRKNILNYNILEITVNDKNNKNLKTLLDTIQETNQINDLIKIINKYSELNVSTFEKIVTTLETDFSGVLDEILKRDNNPKILSVICSKNVKNIGEFEKYIPYIENNSNILDESLIKNSEILLDNIKKLNIKFKFFSNDAKIKVNVLTFIEGNKLFLLTPENVEYMLTKITNQETDHSKIISDVFNSQELENTKKYIDDNFGAFVTECIKNVLNRNQKFKNNQEITTKIFNSEEIELKSKEIYAQNNLTAIDNIENINNSEILDMLFSENQIAVNKNNIQNYLNKNNKNTDHFVDWLNQNWNDKNEDVYLDAINTLTPLLINEERTSLELFTFIINKINSSSKVKELKLKSYDKIDCLIEKKLMEVNEYNLKHLNNLNENDAARPFLTLSKKIITSNQSIFIKLIADENSDIIEWIEDEIFDDDLMKKIIGFRKIEDKRKVDILSIWIKHFTISEETILLLQAFVKQIEPLKELECVFLGKRPKIKNDLQQKICDALSKRKLVNVSDKIYPRKKMILKN